MDILGNLSGIFAGDVQSIFVFSSAFSTAISIGIMPSLAFALFGSKIPGMTKECFLSFRLFFGGYMFAMVVLPLKTGHPAQDVILLITAIFVTSYLAFWADHSVV
jgi:hypothetical protein